MDELTRLPIPLLQWYHENARTLPWRSDPTPYHVWVSEIMLQQTRVAAVLEYYRRFMEALPTVADLAAVEEDRLLKLWQGLGYYNRARNLQKAARQVMEDFGGAFPDTYETLLGLAGVGEYTAGAIASIAFGQPVPAVDGNVLRVVSRLTGDGSDMTKPDTKRRMWADLKTVIPVRAPGDFNQAMMDLGATVCLPNGAPLCEKCPAAAFCKARLEGRTGELPYKPPKKARRVEERVVFLLFHEGKVALRQRPKGGLLGGLWEYPNEPAPYKPPKKARRVEERVVFLLFHEGKVALRQRPKGGLLGGLWEYPNEPAPAWDCLEGWGIAPLDLADGGTGKHIFTHIEWRMTCRVIETAAQNLPEGWVWCGREELRRDYAVPNAFQSFQHLVEDRVR